MDSSSASACSALTAWFCANQACELHVMAGDPGVVGCGEWAVRPDGVVTSRRRVAGRMLCDVCAEQAARVDGVMAWAEEGGQ